MGLPLLARHVSQPPPQPRGAVTLQALKRCSRCIIPYEGFAAALPVDVAQECLPLWLGAAGWVAATAADATVAAMGTWHQQGQQEPTSSSSGTWDGQVRSHHHVHCLS